MPIVELSFNCSLSEKEELTVHNLGDALLGDVHNQVGVLRSFINLINSCKSFDLSSASFLVETTAVSLLGVLEWRRDMDKEKVAPGPGIVRDGVACQLPCALLRSGGGNNDSGAGSGKF